MVKPLCEQRKPLLIDLYTGLHGWSEPFVEEGWDVWAFDIEDMRAKFGLPSSPGIQLILQDCRTIHGGMFKDASLIVGSSPCQEFSYRAMPWKRAKALPPPLLGTNLFWQCWRIQQEACEAAGRYIPMVVENVKGAQPWIGRAKGRYGSFFLWGDVESVGGRLVRSGPVEFGMESVAAATRVKVGRNFHQFANTGIPSASFHGAAHEPSVQRAEQIKNNGGSWFAQAHNTESGHGQNPDGRKGFSTGLGKGHDWRQDPSGRYNSKSSARKAASAQIAKIPEPLARHIARIFRP